MPLNAATLSTAMQAAWKAHANSHLASNTMADQAIAALCNALADTIITHITTSGVISTVTTCAAGAGTGVGTIA